MNSSSHLPRPRLLDCYISGVGGWNKYHGEEKCVFPDHQGLHSLLGGCYSLSNVLSGCQRLLCGSLQILPFPGHRFECFTEVSGVFFPRRLFYLPLPTASLSNPHGYTQVKKHPLASLLCMGLRRNSHIYVASHIESARRALAHEFCPICSLPSSGK